MRRWLIFSVLLAFLAVLVAGCGIGGGDTSGEGGEVSQEGPVGQAEATACAANRKVISTAAQSYFAIKGSYPSSIQQLAPEYLQSVPTCPSGGSYTLQGKSVSCSVHGS